MKIYTKFTKFTLHFILSLLIILGNVSFALPQFLGQVAHAAAPTYVQANQNDPDTAWHTHDSTPTLTGSTIGGTTVTVTVNSFTCVSPVVASGWSCDGSFITTPLTANVMYPILMVATNGDGFITVTDTTGVIVDTIAPVISEKVPVASRTADDTPQYDFYTDSYGIISHTGGGGCSSGQTTAYAQWQRIEFNHLNDGLYNHCSLYITDSAGNQSNTIDITPFTVDTTAPTISAMTFAGRTGTVTGGDTIALDLSGVTDGNLASAGSINVSEVGTLQITSPATGGPISLGGGNNTLTTASLFGYSILASELRSTAVSYGFGGLIPVSGVLTDSLGNNRGVMINIVVDIIPPVIQSHADVHASATSPSGANVTYTAPDATDNIDPTAPANCLPASGSVFPIGTTSVNCHKTDAAGNNASPTQFNVIVQDTTAPTVVLTDNHPDSIVRDADTVIITATFTEAVQIDETTPPTISINSVPILVGNASMIKVTNLVWNYSWDVPSGNNGSHTVSISAHDTAGNVNTSATGKTLYTIDNTAPTITFPPGEANPIIIEATGPSTPFTFHPTVTDNADPAPTFTSDTPAGSTFPLGPTTVTWTAHDAAENTATATRTITINDTQHPNLTVPSNIVAEATSPSGAVVTFSATATDVADPVPTVTCDHPSGSTFALGNSLVTCTATDSSGNPATATFTVTVNDTTVPSINSHTDITQEATSASGAIVNYINPTATDLVDGTLPVTCTPPSGLTFPLGHTTVTCSAMDSHSNSSSTNFVINVVDTTAPTITLLGSNPQIVELGSTYVDPKATFYDAVDGTFEIRGNSRNKVKTNIVGTYSFDYTAGDDAGNESTPVTRTVNVVDTVAPLAGNLTWVTAKHTGPNSVSPDNNIYTITPPLKGEDSFTSLSVIVTDLGQNTADVPVFIEGIENGYMHYAGNYSWYYVPGSSVNFDEGTHYLSATFKDNSNNTTTLYVRFRTDRTAPSGGDLTWATANHPSGTVVSPVGNLYTITPALTGSDHFNSLSLAVDDNNLKLGDVPVYIDGNGTANGNMVFDGSVWNYVPGTPVTFGEGTHDIVATFIDRTGYETTLTVRFTTDRTLPVLTMLGSSPIQITVGAKYADAGATATDNVDGNLTAKIVATNTVDTSKVGSYTVTYTVKDSAGNSVTTARIVNVVAAEVPAGTTTTTGGTDTTGGATLTPASDTPAIVADTGTGTPEVKGTSTTNNTDTTSDSGFFGSTWLGIYDWIWILIALGVIGGGAWWLFGARRQE